MAIINGKTSTGFEWSVDSDIINSWEFVNYQRKAASNDIDGGMDGIEFLLGSEQLSDLLAFHREKTGKRFVPMETIADEVGEITTALQTEDETKNS